jgi:predicted enzyme related to lactoylglutathione lyase
MQLGNTPGAQSRIATFTVPGAAFGIELIEYKDIARGHAQIRFQDPGASVLQLQVRDLDAVVARMAASAGRIWTPSGEPIVVSDTVRIIFLQDPDGIFVELIEDAEAPVGDGNVYGGSFEFIIEDSEATAAFYRAAIGADVDVAASFDATPALHANVATNGAEFRRSNLTIPGAELGISMLEFRDIHRKPLKTKVQDPGTVILQLYVDEVAAMTRRLVDAGGTLITTGAGPVELFPGVLLGDTLRIRR